MSDLARRLKQDLEPVLGLADPRERISSYHDMPYALFRYDPEDELELRREVTDLKNRLEQKAKVVTAISLAVCLEEALRAQNTPREWYDAERDQGAATIVETVHAALSDDPLLVNLVVARMPKSPDPRRDIVFILRTGSLFPMYRVSALLEQAKGQLLVPTVLFYPGTLDGAVGLKFMGVLDADPNYRPKIF
jgi:hypothetical protein